MILFLGSINLELNNLEINFRIYFISLVSICGWIVNSSCSLTNWLRLSNHFHSWLLHHHLWLHHGWLLHHHWVLVYHWLLNHHHWLRLNHHHWLWLSYHTSHGLRSWLSYFRLFNRSRKMFYMQFMASSTSRSSS